VRQEQTCGKIISTRNDGYQRVGEEVIGCRQAFGIRNGCKKSGLRSPKPARKFTNLAGKIPACAKATAGEGGGEGIACLPVGRPSAILNGGCIIED